MKDVGLDIGPAEIVALVGANGAGKTTVARSIVGLTKSYTGSIEIRSRGSVQSLSGRPAWSIARGGILFVPETKPVFEKLTVEDNLRTVFSSLCLTTEVRKALLQQTYDDFPRLLNRPTQIAGTLSGGQKRMLAIARASLMLTGLNGGESEGNEHFKLLILDEPTHGLDPAAIGFIQKLLTKLTAKGISILLVEQMATFALGVSDRGYVMQRGSVLASGKSDELLKNSALRDLYFGDSD